MFGFDPYSTKPYSTINPVYGRILTAISTTTVTIRKAVAITLIDVVNSTASIIASLTKIVTLAASSVTVVTIRRNIEKLLTISVNCGIIIGKSINKSVNILSNVIISLIANAISFINFDRSKLIYAASKVREISKVRFDTIFTATQRLREATIVKFRTIFINKDNTK